MLTGLELKVVGFSDSDLKGYVAASSSDRSHITVDPFFMDLAGNAWSGPCISAILVSILCRCTERHIELYGNRSKSSGAVASDEDGDALALEAIMNM